MKIEIVQLENIRSHVKSTVPFARGFNCLVGGVGSGKSSILYSIDFVFFGDPIGRSYEYLLREGTNKGKVTVQFTQNGKSYTMLRGLKRRGTSIGQDIDELKLFEGDNLISSAKSDAVAEQFKSITGLDKDLFREIVWVRQEFLKELLNAQPRERQKRLDELFGLSDYEAAWSNLAGYQKEYEGERRAYENDIDVVGIEKLGIEYNKVAEDFSLIEVELQEIAKKLRSSQKALEEADTRLSSLEEIKTQNEELRRKEAGILANLAGTQDFSASADKKIRDKQSLIDDSKQRLNKMEAQMTAYRNELDECGISPEQSLEDVERYLTVLDDQISHLRGDQEATLKNMQTDAKRIESLSAENLCPLCFQPLAPEYKDNLIHRIGEENNQRQSLISQFQNEVGKMQKIKIKINAALSHMQKLQPRIEDLKNRINEDTQSLNDFQKEMQAKKMQEDELHTQLDIVRVEISRFDLSSLEDARKQKDNALKNYYSLDSDFKNKESRKKDLTERLNEMKERIDQAQMKIERREKTLKIIETISGIRDAYRSIQPKLRSEFIKLLRNFVQQILDSLEGVEGPLLNVVIDDTYTPYINSGGGVEREVSNLSGGERTLLAFAYRLGLGQLIMQSRTGHGLSMLLLDEPTESLGREDGSIDRLAEAISRFKAIEQIIAVTHSEAFAEKAEHVIRVDKEAEESRISVER